MSAITTDYAGSRSGSRATLELLEAHPPAGPTRRPAAVSPRRLAQLLFVAVVMLPTVAAALYYTLIAADQYASETRFIIRSPNRADNGFLAGFLQSTGFVSSHDDSYVVVDFIRSRAALQALTDNDHLIDIFTRPEADFLSRYPRPWNAPSRETLFRHYLRFLSVSTDSGSGITTLVVRAFRPSDAQAVAAALLRYSEALVNNLNDQARRDAVRYADAEVGDAKQRLAEIQTRITDFRNRELLVDPQHQSTEALDLVAKLMSEAAAARVQLRQVEKEAPRSPQAEALSTRIAATERQIDVERAKIVGNDASMAPRIAAFEQLLLERDVDARLLDSATASLESAKTDAQRQQLYLERIVEPNLPDRAAYPRSTLAVLLVFAVSLAAYIIIYLSISHIREHKE